MAGAAAAVLSTLGLPHAGLANPAGGTVVSGSATIARSGKNLTINQSTNRAILNWHSFSVGKGETTRIVEPSAASAILNRVTGGDPSVLLGRLQSNGQVYLINPNGVMVGPSGVIDTRGFIASTLNVPDAAFQQGGSLIFSGGSTATITNLGTIKSTGGDVALIALHVVNGGSILAPDGQAILAGGNQVLYVPDGQSEVAIQPTQAPGGASVDNSGRMAAASVQLEAAGSPYALAVNNSGQVNATGVSQVGGRVVLDGGAGDVENGGSITAPGGNATLSGGRVAVTGNVDVSAPSGGGTIAVQGTNAAVVTPTGSLSANATQQGNGGHIGVTSQGATNFAGTAGATGGPQGGNGGTAEISGRTLGVTGTVNLKAPKGKAGSLLFDPDSIDVEPGTATPGDISGGIWGFAQDLGSQTIGAGTIANLLASGNLTLQAKTSITINGGISSASGNTLEFDSPTITINQPISIAGGTLVFSGINGSQPAVAGQSLTTAVSATLSANTIAINSFATATLGGAVQATQLTLDNPFLLLSGPASITATNAANVVGTLSLDGLDLSGALNFSTSGALSVGGQASAGSMAITSAGDLTMSAQGNVQLAGKNGGPITLASTGGAFIDQVGSNLFFPTTGREVIYSATDSGNFSAVGLGFPQYNPVAFGSDPLPNLNQVIYIANSTALEFLPITADDLSRTYGATGPNFTFNTGNTSLASLAIQPQLVLMQGSTPVTNDKGLAAGTYTIVPSGAISSNNALTFTPGTFTVNPAPLNIVANNATISFGDSIPPLTAGIFGLVNSDPNSVVTGLTIATTATNGSNAGNYPITPSGASAANYTITFTAGTLTIGKAALTLTITADDLSRLYGAANPPLTASYAGFVNGDNQSVVTGLVLSTTAAAASPVGTYPIIASGASAANYNIALVNGTLTVTPAPLTITANNNTRLYGATDPTFSADFNGLVNSENSSVVSGLQFSTNATSASPVGTGYTITPFGASASNYSISYATGALSVTPAPLLITANDASKAYGAANPPLSASFTGLVNGEDSSVVSGLLFSTSATSASGVGDYTITPSSASAGNYSITYAAGTLSVTPAPLLITVNDAARTYGAVNPNFTPSISGFVNSDGPSVVSGLQLATTATSLSNVGAYPITASNATAANYAIAYAPGTLTVNRAPLTITANDASSVYAQSLPSFGASYSGLVNSDPQSVVTGLQFVANGSQGSPVGAYSIIPFGATATNYSISFVNGMLNITPAALTITADNTSRLYGGANPAFTATYTGLVNGDDSSAVAGLQLSTPATSASNAGTYAITPSGATASNYTITYVNGTLTVNPAPLLITANDASSVYGAAIPGFGASYSGFVNGDTSSVVSGLILSPPPSPANAGAYAIVPSGAAAANYAIGYRNGTLTITPASLTIVPDGTQTYGGTPAVTYAYSGLVNGDTSASLTVQPTFSTPAGQFDSVNFYPLFASGAASPNYTISYQPGTLRVTPASIDVTPVDVSRPYGAATMPNDEIFSGFVNGDSASTVFSTLPIADTGSQFLSAGTHPLPLFEHGVVKNPNYVEVDLAGSVTVNPVPLTITANATKVYGASISSAVLPASDFVGFVNFDTPASLTTQPTIFSQATLSSPVGSHFITTLVGAADPNYTITLNPGVMTITPAPLTIVANNAGGVLNQPLPTLTGTFTGLVAGDTPGNAGYGFVSVTSAAQTGTFSINLAGGNPNYTLTSFTPGVLTIAADPFSLSILTSQINTTLTTSTTQPVITTTNQTLAPTTTLNVNNTMDNLTVYGVNDPGLLFGSEADNAIQQAINQGVLSADIYTQLAVDPASAQAAILPFLYSDLENILSLPQSSWTSDQTTFVNDFVAFVNQQKQAAALVAQNAYYEWYQQQYASQQAQLAGLGGPTYVMMSAALSANPPIPPDTILQEAQSGFAMTGQQAANYTAISAQTAILALTVQQAQAQTQTQDQQQAGNTAAGIFGNALSIAAYVALMSTSVEEVGSGSELIAGSAGIGASLYKLSPNIANSIFKNASAYWAQQFAKSLGKDLSIIKTTELTVENVEKYATKTVEVTGTDVAKLAEVAGPVAEVVADVMQIGISAKQYSDLAAYNSQFNAAIAADNTPVTISSLKALDSSNSTQVYDYLTNMLAGGNAVTPTPLSTPPIPASVYEAL
ncbi:MAG TPA: MBG domain-containing protein [Stellaceae bacterium]|nr:MBG domain-containing protein [Stellaceae bacterium]